MELEDLDIPSITDEEALFLQSLETESPTMDGAPGATASNDDLALQGATGTALMMLNMVEGITKNSVHKDFAWQETEKQNAAEQIAPALVKNGGQLPEWLEPYKEEMIALFAIGSLAFGGYMQVKELRKLEEAQAKAKETAKPDDVLGGEKVAA
ncbi:hypothetical protein [Vibrio hepatarius]|uniref:hypothetical protein n=1 Tax=Vibrio hepatarius TaxID=171383 RepID=UPI00148C964D|nr:hypothetical protein [Vibrio hepatarius]NOI13800.1 hypothetical protein [Vibrio hepatarius]